jgi:hypothetical protein
MTTYRVWYMVELEGIKDGDEARRLADSMMANGDEPTIAYVEEVDPP